MNEEDFRRELSGYELNLPYPFSCFPEPERKKFAAMFMIAGRGMEKQKRARYSRLKVVSRNE